MSATMPTMYERRTIRRYAHELYPSGEEGFVRPLEVEVPYLYARAVGLDVQTTGWRDVPAPEHLGRINELVEAQRIALMADAMLQGITGQEAWAWSDSRVVDDGGWVYDRAVHHGVPVERIKPYPCGPEPSSHDHMASTGDITGYGLVTRIPIPESECEVCTEVIPMHTLEVVEGYAYPDCAWGDCGNHEEGEACGVKRIEICRECTDALPTALLEELEPLVTWQAAEQQKHQGITETEEDAHA